MKQRLLIIDNDINKIKEIEGKFKDTERKFLEIKKITNIQIFPFFLEENDLDGLILCDRAIGIELDSFFKKMDKQFDKKIVIISDKINNKLVESKKLSFEYSVTSLSDFNPNEIFSLGEKKNTDIEQNTSDGNSNAVIVISSLSKIEFLKMKDIMYLEANGRCTNFYLANGEKKSSSKNLGAYLNDLNKKMFYRIHKGYIVNVNYINHISKKSGFYCVLENGRNLPFVGKKKDFIDAIARKKKFLLSS